MPVTTPCPLYDATLLRVQSAHVGACMLGLLLVTPATTFALELGEASIKSGLGQALRVEIPYRLAADEQLTSACIGLAPPRAADALPTYTSVSRISITSTHIEIFDDRRVREPLIGINVDVDCGTAPRFVRNYELFVDLPAQAPTLLSISSDVAVAQTPAVTATNVPAVTAPTVSAPAVSAPIARPARATASARARGQDGGSLTQGQTYTVVRGDTLSGIAARVTDRPTILQTAEAIFTANPDAFSRGNRDRLEAGRSITIPIMTSTPATLAAPSAPAPLPEIRAAEPVTAAPVPVEIPTPAAAASVAPIEIQPLPAPAAVAEPIAAPLPAAAPAPAATRTDLAAEAPSEPTTEGGSTWLTALLAGGVVILLSAPLAFFRRRKPQAAAPASTKAQQSPQRRLIDPVAGIDVVESRLASAPSAAKSAPTPRAKTVTTSGSVLPPELDPAVPNGPIDSVDLDVGTPVDERVDWFAPRAAARINEPTIEASAITVRMPDIDASATLRQPSPKSKAQPPEKIEDEHLTLTVVQLDMLRQDYETEHTLTQQGSQALRDALADLDATKAARAATVETVTLEAPQSDDDAPETTTARVRAK